jgi:photosystem II stability/assembly factor-like uncharacterized protein
MPTTTEEEPFGRLVHQAIDPAQPRTGVEERVLERMRQRIAREAATTASWSRGLGGALIAFVVVAVVGGALGITLAVRSHATPATIPPPAATPLPRHPPTPPVVAPSPTPATSLDFGSGSYSFASPSDGWTLGSACDVQNNCTFGVYKTTDGGQKWVHVAFPFNVDGGNFTLDVTAASSSDAWVWGSPSSGENVLDATHNGGQSWQQLSVGSAQVGDVVVSGGTAWAVTACSTTVPCTARLFSQPITGGAWADQALPESVRSPIDNNADEPLAQLVREGDRMWVLDANQQRPALVRTDDNGHTWASLPAPPCHSGATMILGASSSDHLMLACANEGGWPAPQEVWTSSNGGSTWVLRSRAGYNMYFSPPEPNIGSINSGGAPIGLVALNGTTAWMANDREDDLVTHDDGVTWTHAALPPDSFGGGGGAEGIGFTDALHGWTFCSGGLWTTSDGGVTWREQPGITVPAP